MLTDIAQSPIAETVRRLSAERRSGDLQVRSARMVKIAFFDHGRLVFAASNLRRDRLGEALVADGRITQQDFDRVSALMRTDRSRRFGEALVQAGVMDRYEVGTAVARQVRRVALSLFELADGAAVFEERACSIPLEYMISLSVHRLLYDGIRGMKNQELVLRGLGHLDRGVVLAEVPPFPYEPRGRSTEELEILDLAQRRVTVRRLGWAEGGLAFARLRAVYALLAAGILREADATAPALQPVVQTETGMFLLSALHSRPDPSLRDAIRREVQQELQHSARLDREAWLKLARAAPRDELVRALEEKMERYHALRDGVAGDDPLLTDIDVILGRASSALHSRPDPSLRDAIRREVQQELQHSARLDREAWLKLARAAPRDELVRALEEKMERYHALRDGVAGDDPLLTDIDVILGRASSALRLARQAPETASAEAVLARHATEAAAALRVAAAAPPEAPAEPPPSAAALPPAAAASRPAPADRPADETRPPIRPERTPDQTHPPMGRPDDSLRAAAPGASSFEGQAQIEHLLMEGEVRMTVADYANAVKVYEKLVTLAPRIAPFHLRLAVAMACYPRTAKVAEREFYEAARLEPDNAEIHYQWGLYYKVMKIRSRAVAEMRTAVRLNPKHKAARAELESLSPKDSALTSLKKLFR